jgi:outer membrane protein OmpA-like peptidoglycan-associated protein
MQRSLAFSLLAATLLSGAAQAQQQGPNAPFDWSGFYGGLNAGWGKSADGRIHTRGATAPNVGDLSSGIRPDSLKNDREGFFGGGQLGYNWQSGSIVYGLETDFDYTDLTHTRSYWSPLNDRSDFRQKQYYLGTVRGRVGWAQDRWLPYVTGGWAYGRYSNTINMSPGGGSPAAFAGNQSGMGAGWAAGAGVEYALPTADFSMFGNTAVTLRAEYLYYDLGSRDVGVNPANALAVGSFASRFQNTGHLVRAALNFKFGAPQQYVQETVQRTPPPAAPVQAPRSYLVFFDFDRSDLTPEGVNIVRTAADNAKAGNVTRIEVTGHTDTVGSVAYNLRLSQRRAQTVEAELVRNGIPADQISVQAKGKSEPLVPTGDGVREPQNRRVEIVYQ